MKETTHLVPPTLPSLQSKNTFTAWMNDIRRRYCAFRLQCLDWVLTTGGEQLVRYPDGLEVLISRNMHPDSPAWRATRFLHGQHDGHSAFETPSEALAQVLDQNRMRGTPVVHAYAASDSFLEPLATAA